MRSSSESVGIIPDFLGCPHGSAARLDELMLFLKKTVIWVIFRVIGIIPSISIRVTAKMGRNIRIGIVGSEPLSTGIL